MKNYKLTREETVTLINKNYLLKDGMIFLFIEENDGFIVAKALDGEYVIALNEDGDDKK